MTSDNADAMLRRLIDEAQHALRSQNPADRAGLIASCIQPYAGWALRWAIEDCRAKGMSWQAIADMVGRSYPSLLRQYDAGGPVYTARAAHSSDTRNYDRQTPLRRAATRLVQQMAGLGMYQPDSVTWTHLHEPVDKLQAAQGVTNDPAPLLRASWELLGWASRIRTAVDGQPRLTKAEREVWSTITELRACYDRDHADIEAAHIAMRRDR